jgi:hypothetical protein
MGDIFMWDESMGKTDREYLFFRQRGKQGFIVDCSFQNTPPVRTERSGKCSRSGFSPVPTSLSHFKKIGCRWKHAITVKIFI